MSKLLLLVVGLSLLAGCSRSRDAEKKAYQAGCSEGITTLLASLGAGPNQEAIDKHCAETAAEYVKNNK